MQRDYANYHVGLKILLRKGGQVLFLKTPSGVYFDLPGGRIDNIEHNIPLEKVLDREVKEELGANLKYKLGQPVFQFRRHFPKKGWHIFLTVYAAEYISGEIEISNEHSSFEWINPKEYEFNERQFVSKEEYLSFIKYFGKL